MAEEVPVPIPFYTSYVQTTCQSDTWRLYPQRVCTLHYVRSLLKALEYNVFPACRERMHEAIRV
jgi:hypothetical protein